MFEGLVLARRSLGPLAQVVITYAFKAHPDSPEFSPLSRGTTVHVKEDWVTPSRVIFHSPWSGRVPEL